VTLYFY